MERRSPPLSAVTAACWLAMTILALAADEPTKTTAWTLPVVRISGGDGTTPEKAVIVEAPNSEVGASAAFRYIAEHFPKLDQRSLSEHLKTKGRVYEIYELRPAKADPRAPDKRPLPKPLRRVYFDITSWHEKLISHDDHEAKNQLAMAIEKDERVPSREDLSGRWGTGPNLTGYTLQLEQKPDGTITGYGYMWGCLGVYDPFQISGTYREGVARLNFATSTAFQSSRTFQLIPAGQERSAPSLRTPAGPAPIRLAERDVDDGAGWQLIPDADLRAARGK